jgi:hypothetical protein
VEEERMPNVKAERVIAYPPGGFKPWSAILERARVKGRAYLMVSNDYLYQYRFFVVAKDYGRNFVSWYLVCESHFLDALFKKPYEKIVYSPVYLFDQEELTAYATCAHHCVLKVVEEPLGKIIKEAYFRDLRVIVVDPDLHPYKKRHLIAHGLAHHLFHRNRKVNHFLERKDFLKELKLGQQEKEAEVFALHFLIPEEKLKAVLKEARV